MAGKPRIWTLQTVRCRCAIDPTDPDPCWVWKQCAPGGRPIASKDGKPQPVGRIVVALRDGKPVGRRAVTSRCGNTLCVSPEHLRTRTFGQVLSGAYATGRRCKLRERIRKGGVTLRGPLPASSVFARGLGATLAHGPDRVWV